MSLLSRLRARLLFNPTRTWVERYTYDFSRTMKPGERVLDAGAGDAPFKPFFAHLTYESADFEKVDKPYAQSTYVCDLCERIPVEDGRFDYIVFNQTLEHLKEPKLALAELYRVLAPGGRILCTVPFFFEEHEKPYDFFRYTQFAHQYLFTQAGFRVERVEWVEGFFATCGYMFQTMYRYLPWGVRSPGIVLLAAPFLALIKLFAVLAAMLLFRLDVRCKVTGAGFPKNYVVIAQRPLQSQG
jgi:SAM-dependent methyltransferase